MKRLAAYNQTYILVSLFLTVVVAAQLLMLDDGYFDYISQLNANRFKTSRYEFVIAPSDQDTVKSLLANIPEEVSDTTDITVVGMTIVNDMKSSVIAYYPAISSSRKIQILSGSSIKELEEGELVCDRLPDSAFQLDGYNCLKLKDSLYRIIGTGNGSDAYQYVDREMGVTQRLYCTYGDYWSITASASELVFQYDSPLSITNEKRLQSYIQTYTDVKEFIRPESISPEFRQEMLMRFAYIVTMLLFCLICNYSIISYLFFKLKDEYQISRICGATELRIVLMKIGDLLIVGALSYIVGTAGYLVLNRITGTTHTSSEQIRFVLINLAIYICVLFVVSGIGGIHGRIRHRA